MKIPFFDMRAELAPIRTEVDEAIRQVLDSGLFIGGPEVEKFERELAAHVGTPHAIGVSSGSDALLATMMALGIGPTDEVVTTPFSFFATAGAIARVGATTVFADVDDATLCLDPRAAASACTSRTKAIVTVNLFGRPADLLAAPPRPIIEDAAQSIGAGPVRGLAATLSFFPTKNLGALGDGGAVLTSDPALADRLVLLRNHGARPRYHHVALGGNFRLDVLQAAVLRVKLRHLQRWTDKRRHHATHYRALFASSRVPPELRVPNEHPHHVYHQFVIRSPRRDALRSALADHGIGTEVYYPEPLHLQAPFTALGYRTGSFPIAEAACHEVLALPLHPSLHADARTRIVEEIARFFAR